MNCSVILCRKLRQSCKPLREESFDSIISAFISCHHMYTLHTTLPRLCRVAAFIQKYLGGKSEEKIHICKSILFHNIFIIIREVTENQSGEPGKRLGAALASNLSGKRSHCFRPAPDHLHNNNTNI